MTDGRELLRAYALTGSEDAFAEVVARYVDLVYAAALRQTAGSVSLAEDIVQIVFTDLARVSRGASAPRQLGGWLLQHTRFVASGALRAERRRARREQMAMEINTPADESDWKQIAPALDEAVSALPSGDREVIVLRFFERQNLAALGGALGISEDAAQKRVARAVERLRALLARRGVTVGAASLAASLASETVIAASAGLAGRVVGSALAGAASSSVPSILKFMAYSKAKTAVAALVAAAGVSMVVMQNRMIGQLNDEKRRLQAASATAEIPMENSATDAAELERLRADQLELARLRGEVAALRSEIAAARRLAAKQAAAIGSNSASEPEPAVSTRGVVTFRSEVSARINPGSTLVTGGWPGIKEGKRTILFLEPETQAEGSVLTKGRVMEVPEEMLEQFGIPLFASDLQTNSWRTTLDQQQAASLLKSMERAGAETISTPSIITQNGVEGSIFIGGMAEVAGKQESLGHSVNILPKRPESGEGVEMSVAAQFTKRSEESVVGRGF